jgi:L-alanine-DL-glutamate epimerase-like enolase superfamily enzyme
MRIESLQTSIVDIPLDAPLRTNWSSGSEEHSIRHLLVRVRTDDGVEGVAAGPCGSIGAARYLYDVGAPLLTGHDVFDRIGIWRKVNSICHEYAWPWVLEVACWDATGKAAGLPVFALLGAGKRLLPAYASFAERKQGAEALQAVQEVRELGFKAVKLRVSFDHWKTDIETVAAVMDRFGGTLEVMVDANEGSVLSGMEPLPRRRLKDVIAYARQLADCGVRWLEEPLPRYDVDALAILRSEVNLAIAGGELNVGLDQFRTLITRHCYDIVQPDCMFSAGIYGSNAIARAAEMCGVDFTPHTWSNGVGLAANFHCAIASPASILEYPFDPPALSAAARDRILTEPFVIDNDGMLHVPDRPGLGVELDEESLKRFTVATFDAAS